MNANVEMFLDDPEKRVIVGLPAQSTKTINNPFYQATEFEKEGKRKEAERIYIELLNADFENPAVLAALGMNYATAEKNGLAFTLLQAALERSDGIVEGMKRLGVTPKADKEEAMEHYKRLKKSEVLNAIGTCYKHENNTVKAREFFEKASEGMPPNPDIENNLGTLYINEGKPEKAQEHLNTALQIDPNHAQAHWNLSLSLLEMGEYEKGWPEYDWGLRANVRQDRQFSQIPIPHWDGTPGKKLVVYGEQGIGDEIMFASVLPEVIKDCPNTVFECHKKLHRLFANSFPGIDIYPTREDEKIGWPFHPDGSSKYGFEARAAIGSLPRHYRKTLEDFPGQPYLTPTAGSELFWNEKLATLPKKPNIGISWIGGHKRTRLEVRSIELERLLPILKQDANWISLQYTPAEQEIAAFKEKHGITIHHWPEACYSADYDDTAGLVANLDLVITVCTSVVWLSGALGVPAWVMTPSRPAWRYRIAGETVPWFNRITLFRQERYTTDWNPVIEEVAANLEGLLSTIQENK